MAYIPWEIQSRMAGHPICYFNARHCLVILINGFCFSFLELLNAMHEFPRKKSLENMSLAHINIYSKYSYL